MKSCKQSAWQSSTKPPVLKTHTSPVANPGEGPAPLFFRPNWGQKGEKKFFGDRPTPPPLISRSGSGTGDEQLKVKSLISRVACYADDTKIFKSINSITDCNVLQSDFNDLVVWCESSGLIFHQSKCKYQCITCKKSPIQSTYIINETPLESRNTEKGLYVWVISNLASDTQGV